MIKAIIIEDEKRASENLAYNIRLSNESISVEAILESIEDAVHWLQNHPSPDMIFMDIELRDGNSSGIFKKISVSAPIVYTVDSDHFIAKSFDHTGIGYLIKPVNLIQLQQTILKFKNLKHHFCASSE